jgi:hypothetical protein
LLYSKITPFLAQKFGNNFHNSNQENSTYKPLKTQLSKNFHKKTTSINNNPTPGKTSINPFKSNTLNPPKFHNPQT